MRSFRFLSPKKPKITAKIIHHFSHTCLELLAKWCHMFQAFESTNHKPYKVINGEMFSEKFPNDDQCNQSESGNKTGVYGLRVRCGCVVKWHFFAFGTFFLFWLHHIDVSISFKSFCKRKIIKKKALIRLQHIEYSSMSSWRKLTIHTPVTRELHKQHNSIIKRNFDERHFDWKFDAKRG